MTDAVVPSWAMSAADGNEMLARLLVETRENAIRECAREVKEWMFEHERILRLIGREPT